MLPRPVVVGFSTGIAVLVVSQQVPELLGIGSQIIADPVPRAALALVRYRVQIEPHAMILAFATLILIAACRRRHPDTFRPALSRLLLVLCW